jgi:hypothetical protein
MHIYNNFIYHNGIDHGASSSVRYGFFFTNKSDSTGTWNNWIRNNISYNNYNKSNVGDYYTNSPYINHENNYWLNNPTVTDEDFVSLDTTGMMGPRQSNGNLPFTTFGHLAEGSNLIDAGTVNTGLPYNGDAPDVGWVESDYETGNTATDILTFTLASQTGAATINTTNHTVSIEVDYTADITDLSPTITLSYGATVIPASGVSRDFTNPVPYTVTAEDGITIQEWVVTVTQDAAPPVDSTGRIVKFGGKIMKR